VSGRTRALKIARSDDAAEEAMRVEYHVLSGLDHPNIVRVIDLTRMVEGRLTLIMERVWARELLSLVGMCLTQVAATSCVRCPLFAQRIAAFQGEPESSGYPS